MRKWILDQYLTSIFGGTHLHLLGCSCWGYTKAPSRPSNHLSHTYGVVYRTCATFYKAKIRRVGCGNGFTINVWQAHLVVLTWVSWGAHVGVTLMHLPHHQIICPTPTGLFMVWYILQGKDKKSWMWIGSQSIFDKHIWWYSLASLGELMLGLH